MILCSCLELNTAFVITSFASNKCLSLTGTEIKLSFLMWVSAEMAINGDIRMTHQTTNVHKCKLGQINTYITSNTDFGFLTANFF